MFGPEYEKINGVFKRDERGVIIPGDFSTEEFAYLADSEWVWTEKIDGTNIRLHYNGENVTVGGRTDKADVPAKLMAALKPWTDDLELWSKVFQDCDDVTLYGEGYGAGIQKGGGNYRSDQGFILFDVKVGTWDLRRVDVEDVAMKMNFLDIVPTVGKCTLNQAIDIFQHGAPQSRWVNQPNIEGWVGHPNADLYDRKGHRITTKIKVKDFLDYERRKK